MDIVVEKVFPLAYMSGDKTKWDPPWDEKEEQIRQDCWKVGPTVFWPLDVTVRGADHNGLFP